MRPWDKHPWRKCYEQFNLLNSKCSPYPSSIASIFQFKHFAEIIIIIIIIIITSQ